jgi:hypothetical protein
MKWNFILPEFILFLAFFGTFVCSTFSLFLERDYFLDCLSFLIKLYKFNCSVVYCTDNKGGCLVLDGLVLCWQVPHYVVITGRITWQAVMYFHIIVLKNLNNAAGVEQVGIRSKCVSMFIWTGT